VYLIAGTLKPHTWQVFGLPCVRFVVTNTKTMKYNIIYADPPWQYRDKKKTGRTACGAENHYPCMSLDELKTLEIPAADNCVLFMWATFPLLPDALELIEAWGFKYKTLGFSWIKTNKDGSIWHGVGTYAKSNCEVCLMATRGTVGRLRGVRVISNFVSSAILAPRGKHSAKPVEVRDRIVELFGDLPRVELFARTPAPGWDVFGNEVEDSIEL